MAEPIWQPPPFAGSCTQLARFARCCEQQTGRAFPDYESLWAWSTGEGLEACWETLWRFLELPDLDGGQVLVERKMPGAKWFPDVQVNYASRALQIADDQLDDVAVVGLSQSRERMALTWRELQARVHAVRQGLVELGVGQGDPVAAYMPNVPETVVAFLATASLGAIWTSCAPEFGSAAVIERFGQIGPKVLLAVDGYRYGQRLVDRREALTEIRSGLPSVEHTVVLPYAGDSVVSDDEILWPDLFIVRSDGGAVELEFLDVPFDHPLYVLYSSGTTGLPKAIVHGHGGMMLEHLKVLGLHADLGPTDRFFWFTTTGWMMWNFLVSGLLVDACIVLFDGDPTWDGPETLWRLAAAERVTWLGLGAPYITASRRAGLTPGRAMDLRSLRAVGSTGAPLPEADFRWVYDSVSPSLMLSPISGGTDVCSAFVGGSPSSPVVAGEIPCAYLGASVRAFDEDGQSVVGVEGEMVITAPMPSMPVGFWGDDDGSKYRAAYFEKFPGVWCHGDWITLTDRGSCVISGRSDATLNRGGVRMGTAEIYRAVDAIDAVVDSLVVHMEAESGAGVLVMLVVLAEGASLDESLVGRIRRALRDHLSPRHVPDEIHEVSALPVTLSGKKLEVPVKRILLGGTPDALVSRDSLRNPTAMDEVVNIARSRVQASG